ncbi:uncharacterized protein LOC109823568 [Asparagus officinalis]|uniref:uncharacterized protein LOC109823568 n=1 Tax=Asparagus officinalis TaxID=4686 RepID=UPI00098E7C60|nr:uncharacterized protein LOC109823568 [Asparagus officinalis]
MNDVLEVGPWFFGSRPLMLKPWSIDTDIEKFQDYFYPMWVQFPRLRLNLWSSTGISTIASLIGKPLTTDKLTATRQRLSYARVLIEVKLPFKEPLPDFLKIEGPDGKSYMQQVLYEFKPKWCSTCNMIGHDTEQCRRNKTKKVWVPINRQSGNVTNGNVQHVSNSGLEKEIFQHENAITSFSGSKDHVISSSNQEAQSVEKHAQNEKRAQDDFTQTRRNLESNFGLSERVTIPSSIQYMQANEHTLYQQNSTPKTPGNAHFQLISPTVNASGFTSVNRNSIARRANITELVASVQNVILSVQCITCTIESRDGRFTSLCTIVYALNQMASRKNLWRDLLTLKQNVNSPWIIGGDFNAITSYEEKIRGLPVTKADIKDFQSFINTSQLLHLRSTGCYYTWCNKQEAEHRIWSDWIDDNFEGKRPFKFFSMWVKHPDFISTVNSIWHQSSEGYYMFRFHTKFKRLKHALKELNKNHFMNISEQVCRAKDDLADIQRQLNDDLFNSDLIAREKECIKKYDRLIDCESSYYKQKANINWSLQGDK